MKTHGMMLDEWCAHIGIHRITAVRWRKLKYNGEPMLTAGGNIGGRLFITEEEDVKFWQRAKAGEFATEIAALCAAGEIDGQSPLVQSNEVAVAPSRRGKRRAR